MHGRLHNYNKMILLWSSVAQGCVLFSGLLITCAGIRDRITAQKVSIHDWSALAEIYFCFVWHVKCYNYLGDVITSEGKCLVENKTRIVHNKNSLFQEEIYADKKVLIAVRKRMLQSYMETILLCP